MTMHDSAPAGDYISFSTAKIMAVLAVVTFLGSLGGAVWYTSAQNTHLSEKVDANDQMVSTERQARIEAAAEAKTSLADRLSNIAIDIAKLRESTEKRFGDDERDTKAAAQFVTTVDLRLTRMEAQLDLVVKNITTTGGSLRK